ncbi:MAG: bifunctional transaldolase/phosoglucose isomerase [Nitrospiraceae bacterium]|nr:MAG: bifunctional transaldolase/phosoglucose isomerase [Nitrospiraceae bacterium]
MNPLVQLREFGQSPWYDYIRRGLITSGELKALVDHDGLMGVTSNPSIFEKAIGGSTDYNQALKQIASSVTSIKDIYETLAVRDIQDATDLLYPVYEQSQTRDGYVSLEVSPDLAYNTQGTIDEAVRLHKAVGRENVMIKVPGTQEGLPAIEHLLSLGINVNVTLLFSVEVYEQVAWAYVSGVEKLAARGGDVKKIASVASFFISRIDTLVDSLLEAKLKEAAAPMDKAALQSLMGKVAIANARMAYLKFQEVFYGPRFEALREKGAKVQRLLWGSTGTKNPKFPDTYYVDELIGPDTVNTMPAATFNAFREHGRLRYSLVEGIEEARETMDLLADCKIDIQEVSRKLLADGVRLFLDSFGQLMGVISRKREELLGPKLDQQTFALGPLEGRVQAKLRELRQTGFVRKLWAKDPSLWHRDPVHQKIIRNALGWLHVTEQQVHHLPRIKGAAESIRAAGFKHALLLGMGGSSLCPEVFRMTFGVVPGYPELHVLDSTVPAQVRSFEKRVDLAKTLCIVASKSGSTTEPLVFYRYFFDRMRQVKGDKAGENFIAITDPGSMLESLAQKSKFRDILPGVPDIGGRYSALSNFGIVPAAIMGVNVEHLLYRAERMRHSCDSCVPPEDNPGVLLGVAMGELARQGRDKITLITSPAIGALGAWMEQLIAESTGKEGKGIVPIDDEPLGAPEVYGADRFFAYIRYSGGADAAQDAKVTALEKAGHPVVRIELTDLINLGEEFFLWEVATAVAGSLLGINAFDQPNVQESKDYTKNFLDEYKKNGRLPEEEPVLTADGVKIYGDAASREALKGASTLDAALKSHLARVKAGDYVALNAYVERTDASHQALQGMRLRVRDKKKVATTLGYGPRFLHSTGQLHKGGPNSGVFIQITSDDAQDLPIPGEPYTFGVLKAAQALGDFVCLGKRNRRAIRVHLGADVETGLKKLQAAVEKVLG